MTTNIAVENATKAAQSADLLIQDLQALNCSGNGLVSLLVLPEIKKAVQIKDTMDAILSSLPQA